MFNPVADSLGKLLEPLAQEVREFGQELLLALDGIAANQARTNELLAELRTATVIVKPKETP
jgi:hypothetical protein